MYKRIKNYKDFRNLPINLSKWINRNYAINMAVSHKLQEKRKGRMGFEKYNCFERQFKFF